MVPDYTAENNNTSFSSFISTPISTLWKQKGQRTTLFILSVRCGWWSSSIAEAAGSFSLNHQIQLKIIMPTSPRKLCNNGGNTWLRLMFSLLFSCIIICFQALTTWCLNFPSHFLTNASIFILSRLQNLESMQMPIENRMDKLQYIHTMEC